MKMLNHNWQADQLSYQLAQQLRYVELYNSIKINSPVNPHKPYPLLYLTQLVF